VGLAGRKLAGRGSRGCAGYGFVCDGPPGTAVKPVLPINFHKIKQIFIFTSGSLRGNIQYMLRITGLLKSRFFSFYFFFA
jgi:hypothetical protein